MANTIVKAEELILFCAECSGYAHVQWMRLAVVTDEVLLWIECHKHALVMVPGELASMRGREIKIDGLMDVSARAPQMKVRREEVSKEALDEAKMLAGFMKAAHV